MPDSPFSGMPIIDVVYATHASAARSSSDDDDDSAPFDIMSARAPCRSQTRQRSILQ
jgi:hypothetical protein